MKIIQTEQAPNPRRVRIFLAEKSIVVPLETIPFTIDALHGDALTTANPMHRVPVLVLDDGTCIAESVAICRYFEEIQPDPALFGSTPVERAQVEMWNRRIELGVFFQVAQVFRHLHPSMAAYEVPQVPEWGQANKPKIAEQLQILDAQLANNRFIAGNTFSIADITGLVGLDFMRAAKTLLPEGVEHVRRWHEELRARPSAAA